MTQISDWAAMGQKGSGAGDQVIYYRRPQKGEHPGWIVWGDSLSGSKLRDYVSRGFEPLMKFGVINSTQRDLRTYGGKDSSPDESMTRERYVWEQILIHPDGPAAFPVEQVISMGWYRPDNCPVEGVVFPQLKGLKIREYNCPEQCNRPRPFVDVDGVGGIALLKRHLRIQHEWDQANLLAYGKEVGIDFTKADVARAPVQEYSVADAESIACPDCSETFSGSMAKARLAKHQKSHPVVEVEVV